MKKTVLSVLFLMICVLSLRAQPPQSILVKDASKHIGKTVIICDSVYSIKKTDKNSLLILGDKSSPVLLTLAVNKVNRAKFTKDPIELFKNKKICVTGEITQYNGQLQIEINESQQIIIANPIGFPVAQAKDDFVYTNVEVMPDFNGGIPAFYRYMADHINYPESARIAGISGRILAKFIVEKDGSITNIEIIRGLSKDCDEEALRVLKAMPKFIPGTQNGEKVRCYYTVPLMMVAKDKIN